MLVVQPLVATNAKKKFSPGFGKNPMGRGALADHVICCSKELGQKSVSRILRKKKGENAC
jgi:hypothetical protein